MTIARTPAMSPDRARTLAARALDDAMHALGVANTELAAYLGCDEKVVRNLRRGDAPLTGTVILRLPSRLRIAVLRALDTAAEPAGTDSPEAQACAVQCAAADVIAALAKALADRRVTPEEVRTLIAPAIARFDGVAAPMRARGGDA